MSKMIKVGMADLKLCISPDSITTLGLGSCVGIALRDPKTGVGGWDWAAECGMYKTEVKGT